MAGLFGVQAALLLYGTDTAVHLQRAVDSRDGIGQAEGILMKRFKADDEAAFQMMVQASQQTNILPRKVYCDPPSHYSLTGLIHAPRLARRFAHQLLLHARALRGRRSRHLADLLVLRGSSMSRWGPAGVSVLSVLAAARAATMPAHHADPEPDQRSDQRGGEGEQPQRPGEAPEQERRRDGLGVLDHEDDEQPEPDEGGDRSAADSESSPSGSAGGARRSLLDHEFFLRASA
jgi:hypothetical protein